MKKFLLVFGILIFVLAIGVGVAYLKVRAMFNPVILEEPVTISIASGSSGGKIANALYAAGLVRNANVFSYYAQKQGVDNKLMPGEYTFEGEVSLDDLCSMLQTGSVQADTIMITIPEGLTVKQTAEIFAKNSSIDVQRFIDYTLTADFPYDYLPPIGTEERLEGFLFPETYGISLDWTEKEIVDMMLAQFDKVFIQDWRDRVNSLGKSIFEVIIMASIVEKEALMSSDRPIIAGVFYNRLEINMMLQSCATIQYILGEPKNPLLQKDLDTPSPYNTYLHIGLPPGPIASPGKASIEAALYPEDTEYIYFLAKPDGYHAFNITYDGHNADKRKYIDNN